MNGFSVVALDTMKAPIKFLRETWDELKKVKWPTKSEVVRLTLVVLFISVIMAVYIGGLDFVFTKAAELLIK